MCQGNKAVRKLRIRFNPKWNSKNLITKIKCYPGVERSVFQYSRNLILELRIFSVETIAYFPVKISHYCLILFEKTWLGLLTGSLRLCPTPVETRLKSLLSELQDISLTNVETWEDLWTTEKGERTKYGWNIRKIKFCHEFLSWNSVLKHEDSWFGKRHFWCMMLGLETGVCTFWLRKALLPEKWHWS